MFVTEDVSARIRDRNLFECLTFQYLAILEGGSARSVRERCGKPRKKTAPPK